jgi:hypothetical protein
VGSLVKVDAARAPLPFRCQAFAACRRAAVRGRPVACSSHKIVRFRVPVRQVEAAAACSDRVVLVWRRPCYCLIPESELMAGCRIVAALEGVWRHPILRRTRQRVRRPWVIPAGFRILAPCRGPE